MRKYAGGSILLILSLLFVIAFRAGHGGIDDCGGAG